MVWYTARKLHEKNRKPIIQKSSDNHSNKTFDIRAQGNLFCMYRTFSVWKTYVFESRKTPFRVFTVPESDKYRMTSADDYFS